MSLIRKLFPFPALLAAFALSSASLAASRPNVVLIITDDQGYGDISAHGSPVLQTPNMDRLHSESVRFTNFHVDPTCAPTRGALMSGKYSHHARVWHTIAGGNHLRETELTMADAFKASGYRTAMFGKWHLGSNYPYRPMDRGFDEWLGQGDGGTGTTDDYFTNDRVNDHYLHNGEWVYREGWALDVFFGGAIDYIENHRGEEPFFLYVATYVPHGPHAIPDPSWIDKYKDEIPSSAAWFYASIEHVDQNIGKLRDALEASGQAENTILIFMTDNGGTAGVEIFNAGMRGSKGSPYDGGHRVPFFFHWPAGGIQLGTDVADITAHIDVLPTLIDICELTPPGAIDFDGRSFKPQIFKPKTILPKRVLFVEKQRTLKTKKWEMATAMENRWRLVNHNELYDILSDPGQARNVVQQHPEVAARLREAFDAYWEKVTPGDREFPKPVIGNSRDPETYLHSSEWREGTQWNHAQTASGRKGIASWHVEIETTDTYRLEVRRWPREADAPIRGVPDFKKTIDAWDSKGGKSRLIYGDKMTALPVRSIKLEAGNFSDTKPVSALDQRILFDVSLQAGETEVKATLLDEKGDEISGAYYVYIKRLF